MTRPIDRLLDIMTLLRDPEHGCPWDQEQTFATIAPHTVEEAYEVAEAIEQGDMAALEDELGDLLLQVVYHAEMAREAGHFDFDAVTEAICTKLVRRHPHVFGDVSVADSEAQTHHWEAQKAKERHLLAKRNGTKAPSVLDGVTRGLPALTRAMKLQRRAARVGFDWPAAGDVLEKIDEEIHELKAEMRVEPPVSARLADEMGDLLFACTNLARKLDIDPETALRAANAKFERRFRHIEERLRADGRTPEDSDLDEMERHWQAAKGKEG